MGRCEVIVVNFNAGRSLADTIISALQSAAVMRIYIVDNASTDRSLDLLPSGEQSRLMVVRNRTNLGFAAGCNIALAQAAGDYVLLLNPDCRVQIGAIERLIQALADDPRAGMAGPLLLNPDGSEQAGGRRAVPTPWRSLVRTLGLGPLRRMFPHTFADFVLQREPLPDRPSPVDAISGACMMVRRTAIADVGPLDEEYFLHCEDLDWCMRFHQRDWSILFVPDARVVHEKGISSRTQPITTEWYKHKGMIRYYKKFFRSRYPAALFGLTVVGVWMRFVIVAVGRIFMRRGRG